jgi:hypothetical protein
MLMQEARTRAKDIMEDVRFAPPEGRKERIWTARLAKAFYDGVRRAEALMSEVTP